MSTDATGTQGLEEAIDQARQAVAVQVGSIDAHEDQTGDPLGLESLLDVPVKVTVQIGRASMSLGALLKLGPGSLVSLDREAHEPADILVNGKVVARGEVVTIESSYGVRITSVERRPGESHEGAGETEAA